MTTTKTKSSKSKAGSSTKPAKQLAVLKDGMTDAEEEDFFQGIADDMTEAAQAAIAENDRLGIPSVGTRNGKIVVRQPPKKEPAP
jgi:hypothetical protein